jgi:magnesium transporter
MSRRSKIGLAPGTLIHVGVRHADQATMAGMRFAPQGAVEARSLPDAAAAAAFATADQVAWVDVNGVHDVELVRQLGTGFGLHPLLMEDLVNTTQRPKAEDYGDRYYLVLKMILEHPETHAIEMEQVSLVLGPHWVFTFQEREADTFDPVRRRLHQDDSRVRQHGADYLMYALLDTVVDNYFQVVEGLGTRIEELEPRVIASPNSETLADLYAIKRALLGLRRFVAPALDAVAHVRRGDCALIQQSTRVFLRDVEDHLVRIMETIDLNREMVQGMVDAYLSALSHRMNDVMRVLTVIATIFIPLTFIVGVYGMNFAHMPELGWRWSYPIVWGAMVSVGVGMLFFFRRRGWF